MNKIVAEQKYEGNINKLLLIYGFNDDFYIGGHLYTSFNLKVGDKNEYGKKLPINNWGGIKWLKKFLFLEAV